VRRTLIGLLCVLALVGTLLGAAPASALPEDRPHPQRSWAPTNGGYFNNPWGDRDAKFRIERQIVAAIKHARKGSYIRIAVYSFDRINVAKALIKAHKRGVHVQVLHNDHQYTRAMRMLKKALGTKRTRPSWDYTCKTGCRSFQGVLHDKIYLFEHTGTARNVLMTGSANLTLNATAHQFNDLLIKRDRPKLYLMFFRLFWQLRQDRVASPLYLHQFLNSYQLWVMPHLHNTRKTDPVMQVLRNVRCWGLKGDVGSHGRTRIRVSMHSWNGDRGAFIARRLRYLYAHGCDVKVMWALAGSRVKHILEKKTRHGRVPRRANGYNTDCDVLREVDMYSHQKYLTISGRYGNNRSASFVYTGSSNWTHSGISGDELILKAAGRELVDDWNTNFKNIWKNRARVVGSPTGGFRPGAPYCPYFYRGLGPDTSQGLSYAGPHWEGD
jgi:phosphatidylserine/phosphatidylglycerophosphate/cardiolipin synthase-like enzyme